MKIKKLDSLTVSQIAAGEVIVQPSSVVKELLDNSLDAGASRIRVEVKGGGRQLIRVVDDGCGMGFEDALASFELHATSKLNAISDLETLDTMGFRGEALASIAAVAKINVKTRFESEPQGSFLAIEGGSVKEHTLIPCEKGTSIEVCDLFYNIPARRKFLKSPRQDHQEIQKIIQEMAQARPEVGFSLIVEGEKWIDVPRLLEGSLSDKLKKRGSALFDQKESDWIEVNFREEGIVLEGLISKPDLHRHTRTGHYLYLNKRPIQSWQISQAITQGYGTALPEARFPLFFLHMELSGEEFDVNVHPQKREVRFRFESELKEKIRRGIKQTLAARFSPVELPKAAPIFYTPAPTFPNAVYEAQEFPLYSASTPLPSIIGSIPGYILLERSPEGNEGDGVCLLDQRGAEARILYEKAAPSEKGDGQALLEPVVLELTPEQEKELEAIFPKVQKLGFTLERTRGVVRLMAAPVWALKDPERSLREYLEKPGHFRFSKEAVNAKKLSLYESQRLLQDLAKCEEPTRSPQGKSLYAWIPVESLARCFK